jgi:hypothetical protein
MPEKSVPFQNCECECGCQTRTTRPTCYECDLGLHEPRPEKGTPAYRHNEIDKAYSDEILPMVVEQELKECYSQHGVANFFREMCKHWYDIGILDERAKHDGGDST